MYKKAICLLFTFSLLVRTQPAQSMENLGSSDSGGVSKVEGAILALQKKLTGIGEMTFGNESKLEKFPGLPVDVRVLIAGELAKDRGYTGHEKVGILFSLVGTKEFEGKEEALIDYLYQNKEPKNILNVVHLEPLLIALRENYSQKIVDLNVKKVISVISCLLGSEAGPNTECLRDGSILRLACSGGDKLLELAKYLVDKTASLNVRDRFGSTAFKVACSGGDRSQELVKYLISKGANPNETDYSGETVLMSARSGGSESLVRYLESKGAADVNANERADEEWLSWCWRITKGMVGWQSA